jgi:transcriptional regulator with XRE-family HTH domain
MDTTRIPISRRTLTFRTRMFERGLTFDRLAVQTGNERSRLSRIANGFITPKADEAHKIADALGLDVRELFGEVE